MRVFTHMHLKNIIREIKEENTTFDGRVEDVILQVPHRYRQRVFSQLHKKSERA